MDNTHDLFTMLELFIVGKNLKNVETFSLSDPFCLVFQEMTGQQTQRIGETEIIKNNLNPQWEQGIQLQIHHGVDQRLIFYVYDSNKLLGNEMIGRGETMLNYIMKAENQKLEISIFDKVQKNQSGKLIIKAEKIKEDDQFIKWQWKGENLMNTDGYFGKSDPFLKFLKESDGKIWLQMHKTEVIQDNLNPTWKKFEISTQRLCNGNYDQPFQVQCYDLHDKGANNQFMGSFITTLNEIIGQKNKNLN